MIDQVKTKAPEWDNLKSTYYLRSIKYEGGKFLSFERKHIGVIEYLNLAIQKLGKSGITFCDAGCGNGIYLNYLKNKLSGDSNALYGFDFAEKIVNIARDNTGLNQIKIGNLEEAPYEAEKFDLILCTQVIEHMIDDRKAMSELNRTLKPAGYLVLSTDNKNNIITKILSIPFKIITWPYVAVKKAVGNPRYFPHKDYSIEEFKSLIESAGLEVLKMETFRFSFSFPFYKIGFLKKVLDFFERLLIGKGLFKKNGDILIALCKKE
jgi:SAM-dependent methyltransferase